jgi:anti-anti-sigma regulatory factor
VFNTLLQLLDDGRLTDAQGRTVDFSNTVVIMTSNVGADRILAATTAGRDVQDLREELMDQLGHHFRPEFLNRIDEIILFRGLDHAQLRQITALMVEQTRRRLHAQDVVLDVSREALDYLANRGYQPQFGARPLRRTIQRLLDDELSEQLLRGAIQPGDTVHVTAGDGKLHVSTDQPGRTDNAIRTAQPELRVFCLDCVAVGDVDITAAAGLRRAHHELTQAGTRLVFSNVSARVRDELDRYGITDLVSADAYYDTPRQALEASTTGPPESSPDHTGTAGTNPLPGRVKT